MRLCKHWFIWCLAAAWGSGALWAQTGFPQDWEGQWGGVLTIYQGPEPVDSLPVGLEIGPADTLGQRAWTLQYGDTDRRAYQLRVVDAAAGHYQIDEQNGIVLDAWWLGQGLYSRFRVAHSLLLVAYRQRGEAIEMEILFGPDDDLRPTGEGVPEVGRIDNWPLRGRQLAVLRRKS